MSTTPDVNDPSTDQVPNADAYVDILPPDAPIQKDPSLPTTDKPLDAPVQQAVQASPEIEAVDNTDSLFVKQDGVTHINVYSRGNTDLGRMLAHFTFSPFVHPYYGPFNSMEGFWYYIKARKPEDALRTLHGWEAKELGKQLEHMRRPNFKELIVEANFHKITQNPRLLAMMKGSVLPFDHYYLYGPGKILIRPKGFEWLVEGFESIRTMVKMGREPTPIDHRPVGRK
ncbi:hypothetical protein D3C71_78340 [compost metagenome]